MQPEDVAGAALREVMERSGELRKRAEQMQTELAAVTETVSSNDDLATVTVGAGGIMRDLRIGGGSAATPERIRRSVMSAYQQACRQVANRTTEITARYVPNSPAVEMMRAAVPPDPDDDNDASRSWAEDNAFDGAQHGRRGWGR